MASKNALLNIIFGADTKDLDKALGGVAKRLRRTAEDVSSLGQSLSIGLSAPLAALGGLATKNAVDSAKALAQVEAAVASTGGAAGKSVSQLEEMATGLQRMSLFDDDEILKDVTANLLTFTNIAGPQFDKAQQAILDLSTRLGTDLTSASVQVGKALNDPIKGVKALGRAGVQFSADQVALIESLQKSGDLAGAQNIILKELETQFGGAAKAAADVDPYTQLANEVGNLSEDFGKIINEALRPLVAYVRRAVDAIKGWSNETKTTVLVVGGLLAVLGPTLIAVGSLINAYTTIRGALIAAKAAQISMNAAVLANPYVLAAAAVGVLVAAMLTYKDSADKARAAKEDFDDSIEDKGPRQAMDAIAKQMRDTSAELAKQRKRYDELKKSQEAQGARVSDYTIRQLAETGELIAVLEDQTLEYQRQYQEASKLEQQRIRDSKALADNTSNARENTTATKENTKAQRDAYNEFVKKSKAWQEQYDLEQDLAEQRRKDEKLLMADVLATPEPVQLTSGAQLPEIEGLDLFEIPGLEEEVWEAPTQSAEEYYENLARIREEMTQLATQSAAFGTQFGAAFGQLIIGAEGAQDAMRGFASSAIDAAFQAATAYAIQGAAQTAVASGPAAAILLPALAAAGIGLMRELFRGITGLATGGLTTGPMLAMIGDNPSGKEAVIPFERMGEFLDMAGANQPSNVTVTGRISGRDIMLSNERSSRDRKRIR